MIENGTYAYAHCAICIKNPPVIDATAVGFYENMNTFNVDGKTYYACLECMRAAEATFTGNSMPIFVHDEMVFEANFDQRDVLKQMYLLAQEERARCP